VVDTGLFGVVQYGTTNIATGDRHEGRMCAAGISRIFLAGFKKALGTFRSEFVLRPTTPFEPDLVNNYQYELAVGCCR
jgi:hypothetical protein